MNESVGYLYTMEIIVMDGGQTDVYRQKFGIRQVDWDNTGMRINHQVWI